MGATVDGFPARGRLRKRACAGQGARSLPRHNHVVVVGTLPRAPRVARGGRATLGFGAEPALGFQEGRRLLTVFPRQGSVRSLFLHDKKVRADPIRPGVN